MAKFCLNCIFEFYGIAVPVFCGSTLVVIGFSSHFDLSVGFDVLNSTGM